MASTTPSAIMEPESLVLYNDPLLVCQRENVQSQSTYVFNAINCDMIPNSALFFNHGFYQLANEFTGHFPGPRVLAPYCVENETRETSKIMQIVYKNIPRDQPEFVDVKTLTSTVENRKNHFKRSIVVSDDENDVIFVKEYKEKVKKDIQQVFVDKNAPSEDGVRRNPVRKARVNKGRTHLQKEHLLEEDFDFLDQFEEENLIIQKTKSSSSPNSSESIVKENYKEWPINVFERPEFDPQTNKIEPFDYTIREIQNKQLRKKPWLDTCIKIKKKPKKKYIIRKRKPKAKTPVEKVPATDLIDLVTNTLNMVGDFFKAFDTVNNKKLSDKSKDKFYDLLKNQTTLMAVVNNFSGKEVSDCVSQLLDQS